MLNAGTPRWEPGVLGKLLFLQEAGGGLVGQPGRFRAALAQFAVFGNSNKCYNFQLDNPDII